MATATQWSIEADLISKKMIVNERDAARASWFLSNDGENRPAVIIDRARVERLMECAKGWVSECDRVGDGPNDAMIRAGLQPGDLDPLP